MASIDFDLANLNVLVCSSREDDAQLVREHLGVSDGQVRSVGPDDRQTLAGAPDRVDIAFIRYEEGDGLADVLTTLRRGDPLLPVLLLADRADRDAMTESVRLGACDCVSRTNPDRLAAAAQREVLRARRARQLEHAQADLHLRSAVLDQMEDLVVVADPKGVVTFVSPSVERILGFDPDDLAGKPTFEAVPHRYVDGTTPQEVIDLLRAGRKHRGEVIATAADGREVPMSVVLSPIVDDKGDVCSLIGVGRDLRDIKRAQEVVNETRQQTGDLLQRLPVGAFAATIEGDILMANPAMLEMLGYESLDEIEGISMHEICLDSQDHQRREEVLEELCGDRPPRPHMATWRRKDGTSIPVRVNVRGMFDDEGVLVAYEGVVEDLSSEQEFATALRASEGRFRSLLSAVPDLIIVLSEDGRYESIFTAHEDQLIAPAEELIGRTLEEVMPASLARESLAVVGRAVKTGRLQEFDYLIDTQTGPKWFSARVVRLRGEDARGVLWLARDITAQKKAEDDIRQAEQRLRQAVKMEAIGRLAGGIAHDFNNQLTVVKGYCDMLLHELDREDTTYDAIEEIKRAAGRATSLTSQLLAFGRKQSLNPQEINLNDIVRGMANPLSRMLGEEVDLTVITDPGLWKVFADPAQIQQVLTNLAANASEAVDGRGRLKIETANVELTSDRIDPGSDAKPGSFAMLSIRDDGRGMDEETLRNVFEPFYTTKEVGQGPGLGLAMVYGVVKQSGGHIEVQSRLGEGSEFRIYLPRMGSEDLQDQPAEPERKLPAGEETILLVEDDESVRHILVRGLTHCGYNVLEAGDSRDALPLGEHYDGPIHLLVADVIMPHLSGPRLAQRLSEFRPDMKVLFISGYASDSIIRESGMENHDAFLRKPFTSEELSRTVRELLDQDDVDDGTP